MLIADSGSTKCDWALVNDDQAGFQLLKSRGFNPYFHDHKFIHKELSSLEKFRNIKDDVDSIYFYGAGCSAPELNQRILKGLRSFFTKAEILVDHDLKAAAYACYTGKKEIACILGTGSNSCFYDGNEFYQELPSLAYILGDEASGSYFGKRILRSYFYKQMPEELAKELEQSFNVKKEVVIDHVYRQLNSNVYLASFMKFFSSHREHPFVVEMISKGMRKFLNIHVLAYDNAKDCEINFVGSIAYYFEEILRKECEALGLSLNQVIKKPIEGLVRFHEEFEISI